MRKHGLACDNLIGADVVTADGRFVHARDTENAQPVRGLRGAAGHIGRATHLDNQHHGAAPSASSSSWMKW